MAKTTYNLGRGEYIPIYSIYTLIIRDRGNINYLKLNTLTHVSTTQSVAKRQ